VYKKSDFLWGRMQRAGAQRKGTPVAMYMYVLVDGHKTLLSSNGSEKHTYQLHCRSALGEHCVFSTNILSEKNEHVVEGRDSRE